MALSYGVPDLGSTRMCRARHLYSSRRAHRLGHGFKRFDSLRVHVELYPFFTMILVSELGKTFYPYLARHGVDLDQTRC